MEIFQRAIANGVRCHCGTAGAVRKEQFKRIIEARYADLFALDLTKATPSQLREQIAESYSVQGDTTIKAIRFFLSALE